MARTIWKFPVNPDVLSGIVNIDMPDGAEVLSVGAQDDVAGGRTFDEKVYVWALVDDAAPKVSRRFYLKGTGHPASEILGRFVGTVMVEGGRFVFHLFEAPR